MQISHAGSTGYGEGEEKGEGGRGKGEGGRGKGALERREFSENRVFIIDTDGKIHLSVQLSVKLK